MARTDAASIRPGGQALVDGVFIRTARAWAIARVDGSVDVGAMSVNPVQRVPVARVLVGLVAALRLAIGRGMLRGGVRAANRRLLAALLCVEVASVVVVLTADGVGLPEWPVVANGLAVVIALVVLRLVAPASLWRLHGAEHKAVAAYEAGADPTDVDAALAAPRVHDRCGTNLVFLMVGAATALLWLPRVVQVPAFLVTLAAAAEVVTLAAARPHAPVSRLLLGGGRWLQRVLTTAEPTPAEQAVACRALLAALAEHARLEAEATAPEAAGAVVDPAAAVAA